MNDRLAKPLLQKEKYELEQQINLMSTANLHPPLDETSLVQELVAQYLAHEGYVEAAEAFAQETRLESSTLKVKGDDHATEPVVREDPDVIHRQGNVVLFGNISAIEAFVTDGIYRDTNGHY